MKKFAHLGNAAIPIPEAALTQHLIALGKTRSGKSSKMRVLVEHLLRKGKPVCIIDPKGDWWGLRLAADGKHSGYPIVIFGGKHADVPLNPRAGAQVAELIFTGNRPCLIDLKGWMPADKTRFFIDFAAKTFEVTEGERYLMIDEVHNFAPKGKILSVESGLCLHWMNRLATEAQGMGLLLMLASQRPQKVHNDVLTNCETLVACRLIHKADRDAIKDWIDGHGDEVIGKEILGSIAEMQRTDAWVWSPEIEFGPKRITWPLFQTYDSFKPQPAGRKVSLKGWADVDLEEVRARLASVVKEAEANDPAALRLRIANLERQIKNAPGAPQGGNEKEIRTAFERGYMQAARECRDGFRDLLKELHLQMDKAVGSTFDPAFDRASAIAAVSVRLSVDSSAARVVSQKPGNVSPPPRNVSPPADRFYREKESLPKGEAAVLTVILQNHAATTREQITVITGYKKSSRDEYINRLKARGYVEVTGDGIEATAAGRQALPDVEPLPTGERLQDFWRAKLPAGERKIFDLVIAAHPAGLEREQLDEPTGFKKSSRNEYINRLRSRQLVATDGTVVRANNILFS